jgi:adenosine deaminase
VIGFAITLAAYRQTSLHKTVFDHQEERMIKIDSHRHLGGCVPVSFVWDTINRLGLKHLAESEEDVRCQMTFCPDEPRNFHRFLDKFRILDEITWTEDLIDKSIQAIAVDLANEGVDYAWMDFSINKYMGIGWHKREAIRFIHDAFQRYRPGGVGLILSLKYESMRASQRQYAKLIEHEDVAKYLIGIDLVGDEGYFDDEFYKPIFRDWNAAGKITRAHVGESCDVTNILKAMQVLKATNIAHGFKILRNERMMNWARDNHISFDMAITSNYLTGTWLDPQVHPSVGMLRYGLRVTLGSDDPVQCSTTLDRELEIAKGFGWTEEELLQSQAIALENSRRFLPGGR